MATAAHKVFSEMLANGIRPGVLTYGLCREGKLEEAEMLIGKMKEKGLNPNQITYIKWYLLYP
jgi:pentatricopeptide repeat protein